MTSVRSEPNAGSAARAAWVAVACVFGAGFGLFACTREARSDRIVVGSKKFTEGVILGWVAHHTLRDGGFRVRHRAEIGGTRILWSALVRGDIDVYAEYTGTIRGEIFAGAPRGAELAGLLARHGVLSTGPLGFSNTYAIGMQRATAERFSVRTISDLARQRHLVLGFTNEFLGRSDGWPALRRAYPFGNAQTRGLDHDLLYRALADGAIHAADLYSTDAEIATHDLTVLVDDRRVFPDYAALFLVRSDLERRVPGALERLRRLEGRIPEQAMIAMNKRSRVDRVPEKQVARDFTAVLAGGEVSSAERRRGVDAGAILENTKEHLVLVLLSLAVALMLAVPLGVAAHRFAVFGQMVLAVAGILQTVPSVALLVVLVPLVGIGNMPAVLALFLYSLLPIIRNTHAGLAGIPEDLSDAARALGLSQSARLRLVELPLALPSIMAGIKTAAVINVGTATLGALVGAGGYGQPILSGIRLDDTALILSGALPAAALALAVQWLFDLLERKVVSPGLRAKAW